LKLSPLIAQYLQSNKSVSIEGFGRFFIDETSYYAEEPEKAAKGGLAPVRFEYAPQVSTDVAFIDFVVKETGKIRPLAIADMESYISLAKQLLNISKPFVIEGVGTLVNNNRGVFDFIPGNFEPPRINTDNEREKKLRSAGEVHKDQPSIENYQYGESGRRGNNGNTKKIAIALALLVAIGALGWLGYTFLIKKGGNKQATSGTVQTDSLSSDTSKTDTAKKNVPVKPTITDSNQVITYKVIHEIALKPRADKRFATLQSYNDKTEMEPLDSTRYKLFVRVTSAVKDTTRKRDSVRANYKNGIYKGPVYVEL
jgi:hypothetical protein